MAVQELIGMLQNYVDRMNTSIGSENFKLQVGYDADYYGQGPMYDLRFNFKDSLERIFEITVTSLPNQRGGFYSANEIIEARHIEEYFKQLDRQLLQLINKYSLSPFSNIGDKE